MACSVAVRWDLLARTFAVAGISFRTVLASSCQATCPLLTYLSSYPTGTQFIVPVRVLRRALLTLFSRIWNLTRMDFSSGFGILRHLVTRFTPPSRRDCTPPLYWRRGALPSSPTSPLCTALLTAFDDGFKLPSNSEVNGMVPLLPV